jgi:hypothetical protein
VGDVIAVDDRLRPQRSVFPQMFDSVVVGR